MRPPDPSSLPGRLPPNSSQRIIPDQDGCSGDILENRPDLSERSLRNRIIGGDAEAAEELVNRHLDGLFEFVHYRVGGDRGLVEDVVQDTFIVALERIAAFDGHSNLHTWLCGIARNKLRTQRRKRRPRPLEEVLLEADADIDRILASVEKESLPDWVMERQETQDLVGATLSSLSPEHRTALVSKYIDGESVRSIAMRLGKGEKAVESTLHRARVAFGKVFSLIARRRGAEDR